MRGAGKEKSGIGPVPQKRGVWAGLRVLNHVCMCVRADGTAGHVRIHNFSLFFCFLRTKKKETNATFRCMSFEEENFPSLLPFISKAGVLPPKMFEMGEAEFFLRFGELKRPEMLRNKDPLDRCNSRRIRSTPKLFTYLEPSVNGFSDRTRS